MVKKEEKGTSSTDEFQEIAHCGGQAIIEIVDDKDGNRKYSVGMNHSNPTPAAWFGVYALPQGIPVDTIIMGGIGDPRNPPPVPECFPVFVASDSQGCFGHSCHVCKRYWRSKGAPVKWFMTCPYCGNKAKAHEFLTDGQVSFVEACCDLYNNALKSENDGTFSIDLDKIADDVSKGAEKPEFYYAEESQQNKYTCDACGEYNDILGRYGFCSRCGTRNDLQEFVKKTIPSIRDRINNEGSYETCVKDVVSGFDSLTGKYIEHLIRAIPVTPARKDRLQKLRFHNLQKVANEIKTIFDIDILKGLSDINIEFSKLMFHRRHVYEHKGGEADQKYIDDSGDKSVRLGQTIRETKESAHKIAILSIKMAKNLHQGFHSIFPPESMAISKEPRWFNKA